MTTAVDFIKAKVREINYKQPSPEEVEQYLKLVK